MSDADLWAAWRVWMAVASVVILVAASLLVLIWQLARSIRQHAERALRAAEAIRRQTLPIWELQATNEVAGELLATVESIEEKGGKLVAAVDHAAVADRS